MSKQEGPSKRASASAGSADAAAPRDAMERASAAPAAEGGDAEHPLERPRARHAVAVVGASSFLGANLIGLLEEDPRVGRIVAIDLKAPATAGRKTRSYQIDLADPSSEAKLVEALTAEGASTLVHLGFLAAPHHATSWAHEYESVGTMRLLVAATQAGVRKLVMWSQTALYGAGPSNPNFLAEHQPLRAPAEEPYFADKIAAEAEAARFAQRNAGSVVTVLRTAAILGPTVDNLITRYLSHRVVPTMMGFDPLVQFVHEIDAIGALKLAVDRDVPGTFNIVGDGVLPLSTVIKLAGRFAMPIPHPIAETLIAAGWMAQLADAPPTFLSYLRFLCVADGALAKRRMGFRAAYTTREAVIDYASAQRLRDLRLLQEVS